MRTLIVLMALLLGGCTLAQSIQGNKLPYDSWYLGFQAPDRMEVWLETADVEDTEGRVFLGVMQGTVAIAFRSNRPGWGDLIPSGKGRHIYNTGLPRRIYVRWQSLVEPQTYSGIIEIPDKARRMMLTKVPSSIDPDYYDYQNDLSIGLAPGGWIKVWVKSPGSRAVEVLCTRVSIEPKGPSQGRTQGRYAYKFNQLEPQTQETIKAQAIPYESWRCPDAAAHSGS